MRIVTHAFVRPGRSHDFVCHLKCATPALVAAMAKVHASVERVPTAKGMVAEECADMLAPCSEDTHNDPWNILMWKDRRLAGEECGLGGV